MSVRLNKLLAQRGIGARRKCDELIQQGAVRVNGEVVTEPGTQVELEHDRVVVNGRPLPGAATLSYYVLNKPVGVITTLDDPEGRRTIREFMPPGPRLFPVGRLDADTSGLLILTNDGELAHHLMHPRYGVIKVYRARMDRAPGPEALRRLQQGVEFEPGVRSAPARVRVLVDEPGDAMIEIALHEGRYRQVRRMCEAVGLEVRGLHRSAYGPLRLGPVQRGIWRELSEEEVRRLRAASARPHARGQAGYESPRAGRNAAARLARRLEQLGGQGAVHAPKPRGPSTRSGPWQRPERPDSPGRSDRRGRPGRAAPESRERRSEPARFGTARPGRAAPESRGRRRGPARFGTAGPERGAPEKRERRRGPARFGTARPEREAPERRERRRGPARFGTARPERGAPERRERRSGPPRIGTARPERGAPERRERRSGPPRIGTARPGRGMTGRQERSGTTGRFERTRSGPGARPGRGGRPGQSTRKPGPAPSGGRRGQRRKGPGPR